MTISGKEWVIGDLFGREFVFKIPPYQRPYAWEVEHSGALFDDLVTALGRTAPDRLDEADPYFLGSIVVIKKDGCPDAEVVDGQQRLTTLTILLSVLAAEVPDLRGALRSLLYDAADPLRGTPNRYRLTLRVRDAEFFQQYIQVEGALEKLAATNAASLSDSQRHLVENARALRARAQTLSAERRSLLARYVAKKCFLVVVSTPTFEAAFRIFSVLNDRGMDLSPADVLKADVLGAISDDRRRDACAAKWEEVEEELGRDAFRDLISHVRTIFVKKKLEESVLTEVRRSIRPAERPEWFIDEVLVTFADALDVINNASYRSVGDSTAVNGLLRWLSRVDNFDWVPTAMVIVSRWYGEPAKLERALAGLERLASMLMVGRADVNERATRYGTVLGILEGCGKDADAVVAAMSPTTEERKAALEVVEGDLYQNAKVRAYVLLKLDAALAERKTPHARDNPTVEHVLPQAPADGSQWLTWWPDEKERAGWVHRLGNLLLLTQLRREEEAILRGEGRRERLPADHAGAPRERVDARGRGASTAGPRRPAPRDVDSNLLTAPAGPRPQPRASLPGTTTAPR